ncbi:hypothetical protein MMC07_000479 [Pseudocyphellaria aurata]|nr:hypothetical protein [Pseudocyphellaria aurata]
MLNPTRFSNVVQINRQRIMYIVCTLTFSYLILFSVFNTLYLKKTFAVKPDQPNDHDYDIGNVSFKTIGCSFPISGYYAKTPRYICYLLLVFTVVVRHHKWLVAGAAASVLTYSGVAAIHLIILFATNNRLNLPESKSHCEAFPIPGANASFVACAGVTDPDISLSMNVVVSAMLGTLPTVAWSGAFRRSTSKAILMFWLLLLAVGHTAFALTITAPKQAYQICPKDYTEPLPEANFQAPLLDQSWRESFSLLVSMAQQSSHSPRYRSSPACLYSCFATTGYVGRETRDIVVWDGHRMQHSVLSGRSTHRRAGIAFWWFYTILAFLTIFTTEEKRRLPNWLHKLLFSIEYSRQLHESRSKWKTVTNIIAFKGAKDSIVTTDSSEATTSVRIPFTVLKVVQLLTQIISAAAFCASVISSEVQSARAWDILSKEPFAAVGQWSNLAVVLLVLVAAGVSRIWAGTGAGSTAVGEERRLEEGIEELDERIPEPDKKGFREFDKNGIEASDEDLQWRIGHAW